MMQDDIGVWPADMLAILPLRRFASFYLPTLRHAGRRGHADVLPQRSPAGRQPWPYAMLIRRLLITHGAASHCIIGHMLRHADILPGQ